MSHHHHTPHHHEDSEHSGKLSEMERLIKMLEHWIHHNEEHGRSYRDWAIRAKELGSEKVAVIIEGVANSTHLQNQNLERALELLKSAGSSSH